MEAAQQIREAVAAVSLLRQDSQACAPLRETVGEVKRLQSRRFAGTYADLLAGGPYAAASQFFLDELYSDKDYSQRDAQFARIAGAIERLFPAQVTQTAVALAQLHALTEDLDQGLAQACLSQPAGHSAELRYVTAWREVGRRADRERQLRVVMDIGHQMARLTRAPGLRLMLKMMRGPASAAGLGSLQSFLESGFDTFAAMARKPQGAEQFLRLVLEREQALMAQLFDGEVAVASAALGRTLGQAR